MIVGAGVVGCYLGKILGDFEIWEKNKFVKEKPCSCLVSKTGLESLNIDFKDLVLNEVRGAEFFSENEGFEVKKKEVQAFVLNRLGLQERLAEDAENAGCKILYGKKWIGEKDEFVIGTDGAVSSIAASLGVKRKYVHTYQIKAELLEKTDSDFVKLFFGRFAPGFFGWLIPFDEKNVEMGIGCSEGNVKQNFDLFVKKFEVKKIKKVQSALIPIFDRQKTVFGNTALVGDSAGQVKATTGGGIIFGCKCAEVLAEAIEKNDLSFYEREWRRKYECDLKTHLLIRKFLDKTNYDKLFRLVKEKKIDKLIEEHGDIDHPGKLLKEFLKKPNLWPFFGKMLLKF